MSSYVRCSDISPLAKGRDGKADSPPLPLPVLHCCENLIYFPIMHLTNLIFCCSMAKSFCRNFINPQIYSGNASKLLCTWDFNITNEKAVKLKQKNLSTQIKVQNTGDAKRCKEA